MFSKQSIYDACLAYVVGKVQTAQESIAAAQETSHAETKSSAGDKYETTRAMMQIDIETHTRRLAEAQNLQKTLQQINLQATYAQVGFGSLVHTSQGFFFVAIGIGQLAVGDGLCFVVSPISPIGAVLMHKKVGECFAFNQKKYEILAIS